MGLFKKKGLKKQQERQVPVIESLEPRILLSADIPGFDVPDNNFDDPLDADVERILAQAEEAFLAAAAEADGETADKPQPDTVAGDRVDGPDTALTFDEGPDEIRHELIIVDPSVPDYEALLAGVRGAGGEDAELRVVMIDPKQSGVDQITRLLFQYADLDAIHLISHGGDGQLQLGSDTLDRISLEHKEDFVATWGDALSADGDILIYGCNLAASETGEALVNALAELTGADIGASDDLTGHESLGGDWELEYQTGNVEAAVAFAGEMPQAWEATLAAGIELNNDGGNDDYLISNTGLSQSLTATTVEIRFAASNTYTPVETVFMSFNNAIGDEFSLQTNSPTGDLELDFGNDVLQYSNAINYESLLDGNIHTLSVTWDSTNGDWAVYVDGGFTDSGTGLNTGNALDTMNGQFVFGQEQETPDGGYDPLQYFSGTLYDVRIWNEVRSAGDIALNYQDPFDIGSLPSGLVANWQMGGFNGSNEVVDVVGGNNLSTGHVSGVGYSNDAPTLSGANDLVSIVEDSVGNAGTLVSDLISGHVADPDAGAVDGIAVTAVDDANGTWQYTTDNGSNWYAFGGVDASNARLLAADVNSSVRFVPDADWNGTVTNGITFHAWDQTSGSAAGTVDLTSLTSTHTVLDEFNAAFYGGNDGSVNWNGTWDELGEIDGPVSGEVEAGGILRVLSFGELGSGSADLTGDGVKRQADLSAAASATLTLDAWRLIGSDSGSNVTLAVSADGTNWFDLETFRFDSTPIFSTPYGYDISAYCSTTTWIRLLGSGMVDDDVLFFDNIQIEYTDTNVTGGISAFSSATASSSIIVNPVDDVALISGDISFTGDEGDAVSGTMGATDVEGLTDGTVFTVNTPAGNGTATIDPVSGAWTFSPTDPNWFGSDSFEVTVTDDLGGTTTRMVNMTLVAVNDVPIIGGISTGAVTEDIDPDLDTVLEVTGALTVADPDAGESNFVAGTASGSQGYLIIDASGNWDYVANNTQAAIQQLDSGESVNDVLTVTTADGTTHNVTITINGAEDAPVITGSMGASVTEDGTLMATGSLSISDVDTSDNPVGFPDEASTPGDNGYGNFQLNGGSWSYALNNGHAAVQALGAGGSLTDTHTFVASDGSTQVVSIVIAGAAESVPPPVIEPPLLEPEPEPDPEPVERTAPPPEPEDPVEPPGKGDPEPPLAGRTDPTAGVPEGKMGPNPPLLERIEPGEILLSVINEARPNDAAIFQKSSTAAAKPTVEMAQTFLQELKSFWTEDSMTAGLETSEVRFSQEFWSGVDKMASDLDESVEEKAKQMQLSAEAAAGVSISLTAGFVSWALRAGSMAASFLAAMPSWRHFDPMPVLAADHKARKESAVSDAEDDDFSHGDDKDTKVDDLFER